MAKPLTFHPGIDSVGDSVAIHDVTSELTHLSAVLVDAYHTAKGAGRQLVLTAAREARVTYPLRVALRSGSLEWASHAEAGSPQDAEACAPVGGPPPHVGPPEQDTGRVEVEVTLSSSPTEVGARLHRVLDAVAYGVQLPGMRGWGLFEPVTQPWAPDELSRLVATRRPEPTTLVVVGGADSSPASPLTGLVTVTHESASAQVHVAVAVGTSRGAALRTRVTQTLPAALVAATRLTSATASWWPGPADSTSNPTAHGDAAAVWALLGTEAAHGAQALAQLGPTVGLAGLHGSYRLVRFPAGVRPEDVAPFV